MNPQPRSVLELASMHGRAVLVTGGAGHLGSVICRGLAELGAGVAVLDLPDQDPAGLAAAIGQEADVPAVGLVADLEGITRDVASSVVGDVLAALGRLDMLVNCAASVGTTQAPGWAVPFEEQDIGTWRRALDVSLTASFALTQASAPALSASGHGSVVNLASIYALVGPQPDMYAGTGMANPAAYAAAKGGLVQLTRWLATSLAPDVRVNAISPGGIRRAGQHPDFVERYTARVPLGRMGVEEDILGAVAYLASDLSSYVTGHNLVVDGGWTAW